MKNSIRFSQNFLRSPALIRLLLAKTDIGPPDTIYDIGAGKGAVTALLAEIGHAVVAVEIDPQLVTHLRQNTAHYTNVVVREADFLSLPLPRTPYKVFANIPFNLSADILRKLTESPTPPTAAYLIVQEEFAKKIIPKAEGYNAQLAMTLGAEFETRILHRLRRTDFTPVPRVTSVLLAVTKRPQSLVVKNDLAMYKDFIAYTYNAHKPTVKAALSPLLSTLEFDVAAKRLQIALDASPAQLSLSQWVALFLVATQDRVKLGQLVGGHRELLAERHQKHVKLRRTRPN